MARLLFCSLLTAAGLILFATTTNAAPQHLLSGQDIASMSGAAGPPASSLSDAGTTGLGGGPTGASLGSVASSSIQTAGSQVVPQQNVQVGSETDVVPTTGVFPSLVFQPAIQLYDPVVSNFQSYGSVIGSGAAPSVSSGTFSKRQGSIEFGQDVYGSSGCPDSFDKRQIIKRQIIKRQDSCQSECSGDGSCYGCPSGSCDKRQLIIESQEECGATSAGVGGVAYGVVGGKTGIIGAPSGISTDTVIQPIVTIQPHALQPVPVPVSQPYTVPVPVGVSVPWCAGSDGWGSPSCGSGGNWGQGGSDWGQGGSDWGQGNSNWGSWGC